MDRRSCCARVPVAGRRRPRRGLGAGSRRRDLGAGDVAAGHVAAGRVAAGHARRRGLAARDLAAGDLAARACRRRGSRRRGSRRRVFGAGDAAQGVSAQGVSLHGDRPRRRRRARASTIARSNPRAHRRQRRRAVRADERPGDEHRRGRLHLGRRRLRRRTLRGRPPRRRRREPGRGSGSLHRRRATGSGAEPAPSRRRPGQRGRALRRLLLPQVRAGSGCRSVPSTPPPAAPRRWRSPRIPPRPEPVHLRLHRHRRRVEVRARLGIPPLGARRRPVVYDDADAGWVERDVRAEAVLRRVQARGARGLLPGPPELHARTARWSICSTPASSSGRTRSRIRSARPTRLALDDRAGVLRRRVDPSPASPTLKASALQRTRYRELSPVGQCANFAFVDRLEHDHFEDGRWASPLTNTPRIQVFSPNYCAHNEYEVGDGAGVGLQPVHDVGLQDAAELLRRGPGARGWTAACVAQATAVCQTAAPGPAGRVWPRDLPAGAQPTARSTCSGPRARSSASTAQRRRLGGDALGLGVRPGVAGRAVARGDLRRRAARRAGSTLLGEVRADQALASPLSREVSAACDGPDAQLRAPRILVHAARRPDAATSSSTRSTQATADGPAAPPTLLRNGIVHVPRCAHSEHVAGAALDRELQRLRRPASATTARTAPAARCDWTDACARGRRHLRAGRQLRAGQQPRVHRGDHRAGSRRPSTGTYTFDSSQQPSRLFVNGSKVLDWFETSPGTTAADRSRWRPGRSITSAGIASRPSRRRAAPGPGVTWQPPGASGQAADPVGERCTRWRPASGTGLTATYFTTDGLRRRALTARTDANIDINTDVAPPGPTPLDLPAGYGPSYSAIWEGEIVPSFTEDYTFHVVGSGTATLTINGAAGFVPRRSPATRRRAAARTICARSATSWTRAATAACTTICAKRSLLLRRRLPLVLLDRAGVGRAVHRRGRDLLRAGCQVRAAAAAGSPQKKSDPVAAAGGRALRDPARLQQPDRRTRRSACSGRARVRPSRRSRSSRSTRKARRRRRTGAGLNVTYFGTTTTAAEGSKPDLDTALVAAAWSPTCRWRRRSARLGTPLVDVLASPVDAARGSRRRRSWCAALRR